MTKHREPSASGKPERLRVASYNIHRAIGTDRRHDAQRIAEVIRLTGADIVALQEVENRHADPHALTRATGMTAIPGHTMSGPDSSYGNLLLTRLAVEQAENVDLSWGKREPRGVIDARLRTPGGTGLRCLATHLGLSSRERVFQHRLLTTLLGKDWPGITLLMGDFNEWRPFSPTLRALDRLLGRSLPVPSFPSRLPLLPLDRIWVSPKSVLQSVRVVHDPTARIASDHLPVVGELTLE